MLSASVRVEDATRYAASVTMLLHGVYYYFLLFAVDAALPRIFRRAAVLMTRAQASSACVTHAMLRGSSERAR